MTIPAINYIAVVLATLSSMLVGAIWHAEGVRQLLDEEVGVTPTETPKRRAPMLVTVVVTS